MMRAGIIVALSVLCGTRAAAGEPSFTALPQAQRDGERVRISFAVTAPTDVAVYIEDAAGKVVRHLAAGVLGETPPPPFKARSLAQTLEWDGKADYGKPAVGAPFRVRVGLGLGAKCDKVFSRPSLFSGQCALAIGPDGALYVQESPNPTSNLYRKNRLVVLNPDGSYRRTLLPYAATADGAGSRGMASIMLQGRPAPAEFASVFDLLTWLGSSPTRTLAVSADGKILYLAISGGSPFRTAEILALATDGSGIIGRHTLDKELVGELPEFGGRSYLALSSDGRSLYVNGLRDRRGKGEPCVVYRLDLPDCSGLKVFFGERKVAGKDGKHLGATAGGIAADGRGRLLVCDPDNNRVLVLDEKDGALQGELRCPAPWGVGIAGDGTVQVVNKEAKIFSFASVAATGPARETVVVRTGAGADTVNLVVDRNARNPVLWIAGSRCGYLVRGEERGGKLEFLPPTGWEGLPNTTRRELGYLGLVVDRRTQEVYVRNLATGACWERFDDETGQSEFIFPEGIAVGGGGSGPQLTPAPDGRLYGIWWRHGFAVWDRQGKRLKWEEPRIPTEAEVAMYPEPVPPPGSSAKSFARVGMVEMPHTLGVRWSDGHLFVLEPHLVTQSNGGRIPKALHEYLPSGKRVTAVDAPIIWKVSDPAVGPKFDAHGNIYIAEVVRPKGWKYPPEWAARLAAREAPLSADIGNTVASLYGSIVKFGPRGGMIHFDGIDPFVGDAKLAPDLKVIEADYFRSTALFPAKISGAEWIHPGVGHVGHYACNCENMTFDVDEFGRVFFPDYCMFQVRVVDTAGNALACFGGYGNADNCGPFSAVVDPKTGQLRPRRPEDPASLRSPFAEPDIAMAWPTGVGVTGRHLYVGDSLNRRMVRADLTYAAEARADIR